jgi:LysR family transcriptional regulator, hydrogen peroxide-inducible genes activator
MKLLLACEIDFAIASQPIGDDRMEVLELFSEELLLALPPGHSLARKRTVSLSDLESEKIIVMKEGHCLGDQVLGFCNRRDLQPGISFRSAQLETIQALVRSGLGLSLIPLMAAQSGRNDLPVYRPVKPPRPTRKIVAVWPRQRPLRRAAGEFLKMLSQRVSKFKKNEKRG